MIFRFCSGALEGTEFVYPLSAPLFIFAGSFEGGVKVLNAQHHLGDDLPEHVSRYERISLDDECATYEHRPVLREVSESYGVEERY